MRSNTWRGGTGTGEELDWLVPFADYDRKIEVEKPKPKPTPGEEKITGTVVHYYFDRGFGFAKVPGREKDAFIHATELQQAGIDRVVRGDKLRFKLRIDERSGREIAVNISDIH
ncbi:cold-shock protein [Paenibacillus qinlingensis]|uniref:cold-shock protein n=1 Tax=Paenibacillus qinlingensis TaxID=1837343 RepID=UPI0015638A18|nr:cold shock domain-containing protein [Paenibacillus qinlingensis]NQX61819.1 cold shock domain-containing protein [Paenibacillus qinlingensis]